MNESGAQNTGVWEFFTNSVPPMSDFTPEFNTNKSVFGRGRGKSCVVFLFCGADKSETPFKSS